MDGSSDSFPDDIWSPSLLENIFSNHDLASWDFDSRHNNDPSPLPKNNFTRRLTNQQSQASPYHPQNFTSTSTASLPSHPPHSALGPKRSHLDLPNFPLQANPVGDASNSSGRPFANPILHSHINPPRLRRLPPQDPAPANLPLPSDLESFSKSESESDGSSIDTNWSDDSEQFNDFVDLTADSTPPMMPSAKRPPLNSRDNATSAALAGDSIFEDGHRNKKLKISASQSSSRVQKVEEIDLRDVDDERALSKLLETQRMATIKAQQEQASRPVKLSTLQCIICMENMKDMTATHCGRSPQISALKAL